MLELIPVILGIVQEGLKVWSSERRTRFKKAHHKILTELSEAQNASKPDYNDADVDLSLERLLVFLGAYRSELREDVMESMQSRER